MPTIYLSPSTQPYNLYATGGNEQQWMNLLADRMELARAEVGDLVVIYQSGAYGFTASPQAFLGHPACEEVLV